MSFFHLFQTPSRRRGVPSATSGPTTPPPKGEEEEEDSHRNEFRCPYCTTTLSFVRDRDRVKRANCCFSGIHTARQCLTRMASRGECYFCGCGLDGEGNLLWNDVFNAEGRRFRVREKRGVGAYDVLPKLKLPLKELATHRYATS
jgi:hypothetical protein